MKSMIAALFFTLCGMQAASAACESQYADNPCAIVPEAPAVEYVPRPVHRWHRPHAVAYQQARVEDQPISPWLHRWVANTWVIGICPAGGWAVSPVINGVERIGYKGEDTTGIHVGMGVYVDPDDSAQHYYRRPPGGRFFLEKDRDKFSGS
jgi:hypothetical protein